MSSERQGFILQPTYRVEGGRPVVHLYGKLSTGEPFLVRDTRETPHFWVRARDAGAASRVGAAPLSPVERTTMAGEPLLRVEVPLPSHAKDLEERLRDAGVATFEADVRFPMRYLMDRGNRGGIAIRGAPRPGAHERGLVVFDDPEVGPGTGRVSLSVLSIDIETDPQAKRVLSIALYGCGVEEVHLLTKWGMTCPPTAIPAHSESELLGAFCRRVRELDPDVLTGWNVIDFDLKVLSRIAAGMGTMLELGRDPGGLRLQPARSVWGASQASIPGRVVLDGLHLLRGAFVRLEDYSLDMAAREVLGEGKTMSGHGRAEEILKAFEHERSRFVEYNLTDARLVLDILYRLDLVELAMERSRLTGMPLDRVSGSIASFEFLYMSELGRRGMVAPTARGEGAAVEPTEGGHVLEPVAGIHENVLVFDFKSLYPSLIRTFQIDPLGHVRSADSPEPIVAPNGAAFRREPGILPGILDDLFPRRERAKRAGNAVAGNAIKILMNSFYGVLGSPGCRFHSSDLANAVTSFGRELLLWSKARFEALGHAVLYGDTDSLFVSSGCREPEDARALGRGLLARLNEDLAAHVRATHGVESRLELELETLYLKLMMAPVRHGTGGARKRYAGLVEEEGRTVVVFTGMEAVRRDWTELARQAQRELYERLFAGLPVEGYLRDLVKDVRAGRKDDLLVYRKALRKDPRSYTASTPPHVAAARKLGAHAGRVISYVMTAAGPEPASRPHGPLDHEHYVQKQLRPVAEPVLDVLGLQFDRVVGDDTQLSLFGD